MSGSSESLCKYVYDNKNKQRKSILNTSLLPSKSQQQETQEYIVKILHRHQKLQKDSTSVPQTLKNFCDAENKWGKVTRKLLPVYPDSLAKRLKMWETPLRPRVLEGSQGWRQHLGDRQSTPPAKDQWHKERHARPRRPGWLIPGTKDSSKKEQIGKGHRTRLKWTTAKQNRPPKTGSSMLPPPNREETGHGWSSPTGTSSSALLLALSVSATCHRNLR